MTPERISDLRSVARYGEPASFLAEALDEIDRLTALIATRPSRHRIRLSTDEWACVHPIDCDLTCRLVTHEIASMLLDEHGADVTVELADDGWEVLL